MPVLKILRNAETIEIPFSGTTLLSSLLAEAEGFAHSPCGGRGACKKCAVRAWGDIACPTEFQLENGRVLACKTLLLGNATAELTDEYCKESILVEATVGEIKNNSCNFKYGLALDIGTTTLAAKLFSGNGMVVAEAVGMNPQRAFASDVMGRISAAIDGSLELLNEKIKNAITELIQKLCAIAEIEVCEIENAVFTGNTAMLYFLCGISPESLAYAPFEADNLFCMEINSPLKAYLPPCINSFVGADLVCSVLASGMCETNQTALLCDIGTNGEIALWKNQRLYVTSAAAGPAFEGAGISCGCPCVEGAVDRVWWQNGKINTRTVKDSPEIGLCGSGLIDAVATFISKGYIDASGVITSQLNLPSKGKPLFLTNDDIRALQLAKSAIKSGIETLLEETSTNLNEIEVVYLSGGFGNRMDVNSAAVIGLIPKEVVNITRQIGNGALHGAAMILFDGEKRAYAQEIARSAEHIELGGNEIFNKCFLKNISF